MNKNPTEIVFVLDRSGSMAEPEADTIGGFNSILEQRKKELCAMRVTPWAPA